jgi:beta-hydroxylase
VPDLRELKRRAIIKIGLTVPLWIDKILARYSVLGDPPIYDTKDFPWAAELEANWEIIRAEAERVLADRNAAPPLRYISKDHHRIAKDDKWRSFFLWGYGVRSDANCARCPETTRLVERLPGLQTALFSILAPGAHIPWHNGVTKAFLTCHMGLRVPQDRARCRIRVHDQEYSWREGEVFVFDDMYYHEVWNDTAEERIILMFHVDRPMRFPGTLARDAVMALIRRSPFIKDAARRIEDWTSVAADPRRPH